MNKNKHIHWLTGLVGLLLVNGCGRQAQQFIKEAQQLTVSIEQNVLGELNECSQKGRYTSCWHGGNPCIWYVDVINHEMGKNGSCMLDCSHLKNKITCEKSDVWHCKWDAGNERCVRNRFKTKVEATVKTH